MVVVLLARVRVLEVARVVVGGPGEELAPGVGHAQVLAGGGAWGVGVAEVVAKVVHVEREAGAAGVARSRKVPPLRRGGGEAAPQVALLAALVPDEELAFVRSLEL